MASLIQKRGCFLPPSQGQSLKPEKKQIREGSFREELREGGRRSRYYCPFPCDACFQNYLSTARLNVPPWQYMLESGF